MVSMKLVNCAETVSVSLLDKLSIRYVDKITSTEMSSVVNSRRNPKRNQPAVAAFVRKNLVSDLVNTVYFAVNLSSVQAKREVVECFQSDFQETVEHNCIKRGDSWVQKVVSISENLNNHQQHISQLTIVRNNAWVDLLTLQRRSFSRSGSIFKRK